MGSSLCGLLNFIKDDKLENIKNKDNVNLI